MLLGEQAGDQKPGEYEEDGDADFAQDVKRADAGDVGDDDQGHGEAADPVERRAAPQPPGHVRHRPMMGDGGPRGREFLGNVGREV
jgi:hypothetical protein